MHHPDPAGDSGSVRKMQHQAVFHRRGSGGGGGGSTLPPAANPAVANNSSHVAADDYQPSLLIQPPASTASSSSSGPHHPPPPPHSLNLQPAQPTGAKKKSGFQITSVTLATVTVSTNNSIAEDTESYMESDMDESHTEDLSSSEILDVSLSRANDAVGAERSSSEETLNNFHEAETPGAVSPNQPSHPHALAQAQQRGGGGGAMVNGTMHHQHPHHPNHAQSYPLTGALPSLAQKMPSNVGGPQENVSHAAPPSVVPQPAGVVAPGSLPGMHSSAAGSTVSVANPQTSSVSNVNMLSSANVPVRGGVSTGASGGGAGGGGGVAVPTGGSHMSAANVNMIQQQQQNINSATAAAAVSASGGAGVPSGTQGRVGSAASAPAAAAQPPAAAPAPAPAVTATTSRFRVVKLDSSSEPFKKGRWMCTEFYDKDAPSAPPASEAASLSSRQFVTESFAAAGASERERESTSGSSVSSTVSTLSHYVENVGSGEAGGSPVPQHAQDYASPPQGYQGIIPSGLSMGVPHSQAHMHTQDLNHSHLKTTAAPSAPASAHQPAAMPGQQTVPPQQLTYAQAVIANQTPGSSQGPVGIQQQKMGYAPLPQQSAASQPAPPGSVRAPEYNPAQQGAPQAAASQPLSSQAGSVPAGPANGATQMMGGPQQSQGLLHKPAPASSVPLGQPPQGHVDVQQKPQSLATPVQNAGPSAQLPEHQAQPQAHSAANVGRMAPQPSSMGLMQDHSSVQALVHAAQASALYASLPSFTTTQLQDAQRLLLQHQSLLKLSGMEAGSSAGLGQETEGNSNAASALTAPAGLKTVDGEDDGSSGASVVAIDNKIEQAMDLVKSHLMYAVREEVEVLKEQIKELIERNSQLEQENTLLKTLASPEQMAQFQAQVQTGSPPAPQTAAPTGPPGAAALAPPASHSSGPSA